MQDKQRRPKQIERGGGASQIIGDLDKQKKEEKNSPNHGNPNRGD